MTLITIAVTSVFSMLEKRIIKATTAVRINSVIMVFVEGLHFGEAFFIVSFLFIFSNLVG